MTKRAELGLGEKEESLLTCLLPAGQVAKDSQHPRWTELLRNEVSAPALNPLVDTMFLK